MGKLFFRVWHVLIRMFKAAIVLGRLIMKDSNPWLWKPKLLQYNSPVCRRKIPIGSAWVCRSCGVTVATFKFETYVGACPNEGMFNFPEGFELMDGQALYCRGCGSGLIPAKILDPDGIRIV